MVDSERYKRFYARHKEKRNQDVITRRFNKKKELIEYKGGKCSACGLIDPCVAIYEFHHLEPEEKEFSITEAILRGCPIEELKKEADKCILLCANCHRRLNVGERYHG